MELLSLELLEAAQRRFAAADRMVDGERPGTFEFLGFKHVCGVDRSGKFALIRIPSVRSCRKFLARTHEWLGKHPHWKKRDQQQQLQLMLRGFYQYFGLHHCERKLQGIRAQVQLQWIRSLRHRSQRQLLSWSYLLSRQWFELPYPRTVHPTV